MLKKRKTITAPSGLQLSLPIWQWGILYVVAKIYKILKYISYHTNEYLWASILWICIFTGPIIFTYRMHWAAFRYFLSSLLGGFLGVLLAAYLRDRRSKINVKTRGI